MTDKIPVKLVVSDIDNTISDYFNIWAHETGRAIDAVAKSRGIDITDKTAMDAVYASILEGSSVTKTGARFHDFARMIRETPIFDTKNLPEAERRAMEKADAKAAHEFQKRYAAGKSIYEGVLETVDKMHEAGIPFVLYTDSPEDGALRSLVHMGFPIEKLDGLVCRANDADEILPNGKVAPLQIDGGKIATYKAALKAKLGDKYVVNSGNVWKPNPSVMQGILDRHGAKAEETVMVGDNIKSDGGFVVMGVNYAFQAEGSEVDAYTSQMNSNLSEMKDYKLGKQAHLNLMAERCAKDPVLAEAYKNKMITLETGFGELDKHFVFTKNPKAHKIEQYKETVRQEKKTKTATPQLIKKMSKSNEAR